MKKIIVSIALLFITATAMSQSFMNGIGISYLVSSSNNGSDFGFVFGFNYYPRIQFAETENTSLSVGIPLTLGFAIGTANSGNDDEIGVAANIPLLLSFNMGRGSSKENRDKVGFFVGGGMAYHLGTYTDFYDNSSTSITSIYGVAGNAGIRLGVGKKHRNIELRLSYMKGLNKSKPHIFGFGCSFNL